MIRSYFFFPFSKYSNSIGYECLKKKKNDRHEKWKEKLLAYFAIFNDNDNRFQGSASEATLVCLLAAKERTTKYLKALHPDWNDATIKSKLVAYTSGKTLILYSKITHFTPTGLN